MSKNSNISEANSLKCFVSHGKRTEGRGLVVRAKKNKQTNKERKIKTRNKKQLKQIKRVLNLLEGSF